MEVIVVGLNRRNAPEQVFQDLQRDSVLERTEQRLRGIAGVREVVRVATSQRIEFVVGVSSLPLRSAVDARGSVEPRVTPRPGGPTLFVERLRNALLAANSETAAREFAHDLEIGTFALEGGAAFGHLLRVAVGLDRLEGEDQELEALRSAYAEAVERGAAGPFLSAVFHRVFRSARRIGRAAPQRDRLHDIVSAPSALESEIAAFVAWQREREIAPTIFRLGRLLELSGLESSEEAGGGEEFRRRLLQGFSAVAGKAASEEEAASRLALFEQALEHATKRTALEHATKRSALERGDGPHRRAEVKPAARARRSVPGRPPLRDSREPLPAGSVSLVGAGPGDPELLTLKARRRLWEADVVYYDALVDTRVLAHCRAEARLVAVGKRRGATSLAQNEIEEALVRDARAGLAVVRLKGGDPFVFGRGGEEALALVRSGIPFEVVPGVSSGIAVPALAGIPLTHRGMASSAAFITAHDLEPGPAGDSVRRKLIDLSRGADTLVLFMAGAELTRIRQTLLEAGVAGDTPAALIESGSTPQQRVTTATVAEMSLLEGARTGGPVLLIVGRTVALSASLRARDSRAGAAGIETQEIFTGHGSAAGMRGAAKTERPGSTRKAATAAGRRAG